MKKSTRASPSVAGLVGVALRRAPVIDGPGSADRDDLRVDVAPGGAAASAEFMRPQGRGLESVAWDGVVWCAFYIFQQPPGGPGLLHDAAVLGPAWPRPHRSAPSPLRPQGKIRAGRAADDYRRISGGWVERADVASPNQVWATDHAEAFGLQKPRPSRSMPGKMERIEHWCCYSMWTLPQRAVTR